MKRRTLLQAGGLALGTTSLAWSQREPIVPAVEWLLLFWLPYDNDLSPLAETIREAIAQGLPANSRNLAVAIQIDRLGDRGMSRQLWWGPEMQATTTSQENSASAETWQDFARWTLARVQPRRWGVLVLGHGGRFGEISPDVQPTRTIAPVAELAGAHWLRISALVAAISAVGQSQHQPAELLFWQNCDRGTIETHYESARAARYTLSSQHRLGAPNTYYGGLLTWLADHPAADGREVAEAIARFESPRMYSSLTLSDNKRFAQLPDQLNPLLEPLLGARGNPSFVEPGGVEIYHYFGDRYVDVLAGLGSLAMAVPAAARPWQTFRDWFPTTVTRFISPAYRHQPDRSGLGLWLPPAARSIDRLRQEQGDWSLYRQTRLLELLARLELP